MPLYEYACEACGAKFELIQKFADAPAETCKVCGSGPVRKLVSSPAFQFKGSGWYITDYARKGESDSSKKESGSKDSGSEKSTGEKSTSDKTADKPAPATTPSPTKDSSS